MRRPLNETEKYPDTHKSFALFPFVCEKCHNVIWLEHKYWAIAGPYYSGHGTVHEACCKCIPKRKDADDFFFKTEFAKPKFRPPYNPPSQTKPEE